jgi:hypothetical protein
MSVTETPMSREDIEAYLTLLAILRANVKGDKEAYAFLIKDAQPRLFGDLVALCTKIIRKNTNNNALPFLDWLTEQLKHEMYLAGSHD